MNTKVFKIGLIAMCAVGFLAGCGDELAYLSEKKFSKEEFSNKEFLSKIKKHCELAQKDKIHLDATGEENCSNAFHYSAIAYLNEREFAEEEFKNKDFLLKVYNECGFAKKGGAGELYYDVNITARKNCSNAIQYHKREILGFKY
ncbi:hypothetical protein [Helicobacter winghamensis]|uniref:hypothetical protein n=1 Tax=Helicobacter winghamensis TaxID=157268 RepID=UPI002797CAD9